MPEDIPPEAFADCRGKIAKESAHYTPLLAKTFWKAITPTTRTISAVGLQRASAKLLVDEKGHEAVWKSLVVRQTGLKTPEGKSPKALAARDKALAGHRRRGTWDESTVTEFRDLMRDHTQKEIMCGRVFGILGNKHDECDEDEHEMKFRAVFQGSNIRTKTGVSAIDLLEGVSSAPASFTAIRCGLAAAVLRKLIVSSIRDALQACLQARINTPDRIPTWVELPEDWWPDAWYWDGAARQQPKYTRPMVLLILTLYGHPESGVSWEALLTKALKTRGWHSIPEWPGVFIHSDLSILVVYVDDLMLCAVPGMQAVHWKSIDEAIEFEDPPADIDRFIGAQYNLAQLNLMRRLQTQGGSDMCHYVANMATRFSTESGLTLKSVPPPYLPDDQWTEDNDTPGRFAPSCASYAATSLFVSRVARPELSNITQRLCSAVARWAVVHDAALIRMMSYAAHNADMVLCGQLSPLDLED